MLCQRLIIVFLALLTIIVQACGSAAEANTEVKVKTGAKAVEGSEAESHVEASGGDERKISNNHETSDVLEEIELATGPTGQATESSDATADEGDIDKEIQSTTFPDNVDEHEKNEENGKGGSSGDSANRNDADTTSGSNVGVFGTDCSDRELGIGGDLFEGADDVFSHFDPRVGVNIGGGFDGHNKPIPFHGGAFFPGAPTKGNDDAGGNGLGNNGGGDFFHVGSSAGAESFGGAFARSGSPAGGRSSSWSGSSSRSGSNLGGLSHASAFGISSRLGGNDEEEGSGTSSGVKGIYSGSSVDVDSSGKGTYKVTAGKLH